MGIATVLHWNRFTHDHPAFWIWVELYFTTPLLIVAMWLRNHPYEPPADPGESTIPHPAAWVIAAVGALALGTGLTLFVVPGTATMWWPWALTPLTAQVLGAIFCLGSAGIGALVDRRWSSARVPFPGRRDHAGVGARRGGARPRSSFAWVHSPGCSWSASGPRRSPRV